MDMTTGNLNKLLSGKAPLPIVGVINSYCALMAQKSGFKALYLSGAGVANAQYGLPDLGLTSLSDVCEEVRRITRCCSLPLLVDADTGWGGPLNIKNSIKLLELSGAAGVHIEDQLFHKRCGHREGKKLVTLKEMVVRISAACHGRHSNDFMIMARTDALAVEGIDKTLERAKAYQNAGANALFLEAVTNLEQIKPFKESLRIPILLNITEFGKTPLWSVSELAKHNVDAILYPLSAFRAMNKAAQNVYDTIMKQGSQKSVLDTMQTRDELYDNLNYQEFEEQLDNYLED
jgi:methylisocitrate lyase